MAGPPNSFYHIMDQFFGYPVDEESETREVTGTTSTAPRAATLLPNHLQSVCGKTTTTVTGGSESETPKSHSNLVVTKAVIFKPGPKSRIWSRVGLHKEFQTVNNMGKYRCPMCLKYEQRSNIDTVAMHICRDHLNMAL